MILSQLGYSFWMSTRFGTLRTSVAWEILKKSPGFFCWQWWWLRFLSMMMNRHLICGSKLLPPKTLSPLSNWVKLLRDVGGPGDWWRIPSAKKKCGAKKLFFLRSLKIQRKIALWSTKMATGSSRYSFESKVPATTQKKGFNRAFPQGSGPVVCFGIALICLICFLKHALYHHDEHMK